MKVLIVDAEALFRAGLCHLLRRVEPDCVLDEAGTCAEALGLLAAGSYDLVLLVLALPGAKGFEALDALHAAAPGTPVMVLSGDDDPRLVRAAFARGAMGFLPKNSDSKLLIHAVGLVLAQGVYLPPSMLRAGPAAAQPAGLPRSRAAQAPPVLTERQMQILRAVVTGKTNRAIAQALNLSEATIKSHLTLTFRALGVSRRTEAIHVAAKLGLPLG